jgi:hypothetical protein
LGLNKTQNKIKIGNFNTFIIKVIEIFTVQVGLQQAIKIAEAFLEFEKQNLGKSKTKLFHKKETLRVGVVVFFSLSSHSCRAP